MESNIYYICWVEIRLSAKEREVACVCTWCIVRCHEERGGCPVCLPPSLDVGQHLVKSLTVVLILAALAVK